jgi:hypothetical protein
MRPAPCKAVTTTWSSIAAAARKSDFPLTVGSTVQRRAAQEGLSDFGLSGAALHPSPQVTEHLLVTADGSSTVHWTLSAREQREHRVGSRRSELAWPGGHGRPWSVPHPDRDGDLHGRASVTGSIPCSTCGWETAPGQAVLAFLFVKPAGSAIRAKL